MINHKFYVEIKGQCVLPDTLLALITTGFREVGGYTVSDSVYIVKADEVVPNKFLMVVSLDDMVPMDEFMDFLEQAADLYIEQYVYTDEIVFTPASTGYSLDENTVLTCTSNPRDIEHYNTMEKAHGVLKISVDKKSKYIDKYEIADFANRAIKFVLGFYKLTKIEVCDFMPPVKEITVNFEVVCGLSRGSIERIASALQDYLSQYMATEVLVSAGVKSKQVDEEVKEVISAEVKTKQVDEEVMPHSCRESKIFREDSDAYIHIFEVVLSVSINAPGFYSIGFTQAFNRVVCEDVDAIYVHEVEDKKFSIIVINGAPLVNKDKVAKELLTYLNEVSKIQEKVTLIDSRNLRKGYNVNRVKGF